MTAHRLGPLVLDLLVRCRGGSFEVARGEQVEEGPAQDCEYNGSFRLAARGVSRSSVGWVVASTLSQSRTVSRAKSPQGPPGSVRERE
jgi:hypothetical protein